MKKLAILSGSFILGCTLLKALFFRKTLIHRCPECNLVIRKNTLKCLRCDTLFDWSWFIDESVV